LVIALPLIIFNGIQFFKQFKNEGLVTLDLRTYYLSTELYWKGINPYSDSMQVILNDSYKERKLIEINRKAGFPHAVCVYLPQFVWEFFLFNKIDFKVLQWIQMLFNILSIIFISWMLSKLNSTVKFYNIVLTLFAFRGTWYALMNGQPMFIALNLLILAYYCYKKNKLLFSSVLFALAGFKVTFLIPFIGYFLYQKHYKLLSFIFLFLLMFNLLPVLYFSDPMALVKQWLENMEKLFEFTHSYSQINGLNLISTSITIPLAYFIDISTQSIKLLSVISMLFIFVLLKYNQVKPDRFLIVFSIAFFTFSHFLIYDLVFLILIHMLISNKINNYYNLGMLLFLAIPISKIVESVKIEALYFYIPYGLFIVTMVTTINCFIKKRMN